MPKAREQFAEFLDQDSLDRFGMLYLTTCVGFGYGRHENSRRRFSRRQDTPDSGHKTPHHHASRSCQADLPAWRATRLTTDYHRRGPAIPSRRSRAAIPAPAMNHQPGEPPESGRPADEGHSIDGSSLTRSRRYETINSFIHSTTPVGLALGPDSPRDDERCPGTLGHPAGGIPTRLSLLMSAFSLPRGPRPGHPAASPPAERSPTQRDERAAASSVACLSPATLSARSH